MGGCEIPLYNATEQEIADILHSAKTVAVVGISHNEARDSHKVAKYLQEHGYTVIPVNLKYREVLGRPCYPDLRSVPEKVDVVDIFRNVEAIPGIVDEAIAIGAKVVWMQLGLVHNDAAEKARQSGLKVVMNRCMKVEHQAMCLSQKQR